MTAPRKPGFVLPVAVTLVVLLGLYVGAYYWAVEPIDFGDWVADLYSPTGRTPSHGYDPTSWLRDVFGPMNWIDRRIRPNVWEPRE